MFNRIFRRGGASAEEGLEKTRRSWVDRLVQVFDRTTIDDTVWDELEEVLILGDVGMETGSALIQGVRQRVQREGVKTIDGVKVALREEMGRLLERSDATSAERVERILTWPQAHPDQPQVILVVGVNGSGKTTSIAKLAALLQDQGHRVLLGAADTFRAAAIDQLKEWGRRLGIDVIAHQPGSDPGAVAFDAIQAANSRRANTVIIDTAGRLHTKTNLMEELKKVRRVAGRVDPTAPHEVLLVLDATTGQNAIAQAKSFTEAVDVTGLILAKLDGSAKGGTILAIAQQLALPVLFLGTGEKPEDLAVFEPQEFVSALLT